MQRALTPPLSTITIITGWQQVMFKTRLSNLTPHTKATAEHTPLAFLQTAPARPLQSQSLVSALQLPEPAVEKSSWLLKRI